MSTASHGGDSPAPDGVAWAAAPPGSAVSVDQTGRVLHTALEDQVQGERVLVLVPDRTRDVALAELFPAVLAALHRARSVEVMVALGTHPPMDERDIAAMLGLGAGAALPAPVTGLRNHSWREPGALARLGTVAAERIRQIAGPTWHPSLGGDLVVRANRRAVEVDRVVVVGPVLPHEVAGFSGGAKYIFPGISGPEMIDVMHWLGALSGVLATIGRRDTPVRALIEEATRLLTVPVTLVAVATEQGRTAGLYAGAPREAWEACAEHAARLHVERVEHPYHNVISCPMPIYDELWTAGKAMYKLEPAVADGGRLVIYAPHLNQVSATHGADIFRVGYHPLAYFVGQWERFASEPLAVLAHSSHVKGAGTYDAASGRESPRIDVALATGIPEEDCRRLNLSYVDPARIDPATAALDGSTLVVRRSGETLYRVGA